MRAVHPGKVLSEELDVLGVSPSELARQLQVPANRITQIVRGQRTVTGDTALRLGHWFDVSAEFWLNLQSQYDLAIARQKIGEHLGSLQRRSA